jgi:Tol biopolymer transport system component
MKVYLVVLLVSSIALTVHCKQEQKPSGPPTQEQEPRGPSKPDTYYIYYSSDRDGPGIYATTTTGGSVKKLTSLNYTSTPWDIELSENHSLIFYGAQPPTGEDNDLYRVDTTGNGEINLTTASGASSAANEGPDFAALGWIYIGSERSNYNGWYHAYRMHSDGANTQAISPQTQMWYTMTISPDKSKIIFDNADNYNKHTRIYSANPDGSNRVLVYETPSNYGRTHGGAWLPNTDKIIFAAGPHGGDYRLYTINSDGTGLDSLGFYSADNWPSGQPWWGMKYKFYTNDGQRIVFSSNPNGNYDIYLQNIDGTGRTQLTTDNSDDVHPLIISDDQRILFISNRSGTRSIWIMDIDGSNKTQITDDQGTEVTFRVGAVYTTNEE